MDSNPDLRMKILCHSSSSIDHSGIEAPGKLTLELVALSIIRSSDQFAGLWIFFYKKRIKQQIFFSRMGDWWIMSLYLTTT